MKLLIITQILGKSPAGNVFLNLIEGLAEYADSTYVICAESNSNVIKNSRIFEIPFGLKIPIKINKIFIILFGISLRHFYWEQRAKQFGNKLLKENRPDIIITFASGGSEAALNLGYKLSSKNKIRYAVHMVDPIPPPKGWETFEFYRKSLIRTVKKPLMNCTYLSMNTKEMILLQQQSLSHNLLNKSFVATDPVSAGRIFLGKPEVPPVFTYMGSFYGARKPDKLIYGFALFLQSGMKALLRIVGNNKLDLSDYEIPVDVKNKILMDKWTSNVEKIYRESTILVDVDADIENDVFISSKLKTYLTLDRIILSLTRKESPSYQLLYKIKNSVIITDHDIINICDAMKKCLLIDYNKELFNDRDDIINSLSVSNIARNMAIRYGIWKE